MIGSAAKRYARALFAIGEERKALHQIASEVEALAATWSSSSELASILEDPSYPIARRREMLLQLGDKLGLGDDVRSAAMLLLDRKRLRALPDIARALRAMTDDREGKVRAEVVSATVLDESYYERLRAELEAATGKSVILARRHDPSLIAGLVTRIGDRLYDGSARTRLAEIRESLVER